MGWAGSGKGFCPEHDGWCGHKEPCMRSRLSEDGKQAVEAVESMLEGSVFGGNYSNADCAAIADAWERRTGKRPSQAWLRMLRTGRAA
jgi:hypothetical protein